MFTNAAHLRSVTLDMPVNSDKKLMICTSPRHDAKPM